MRNGGIQLRVGDLLFAVQKHWKIIVTLTFLGGIFGLLLSGMSYVQSNLSSYTISGSMAINTMRADGTYLYGSEVPNQNDFHLAEDMVDSVIYVMRSRRVLDEVVNRQELLGMSYEDVRNGLTITSYGTTQILEMTLNWATDEEGMAIWHAIIECANEVMTDTLTMGHLSVINECRATLVGVGGAGKSMPFLLTILGFAAGIGYAVLELLMRPTLTNVKDIESVLGMETIGIIPRDDSFFRKKGSILVKDDIGTSPVAQNYSAAAFILRNRLGTKENHHCFYVTSATNREGRSTVAANLAIQLSDMEHHTLLVDFDLKNPGIGALFMENVDYQHSLNALYRGEITEHEAITTLTGYLDILPAVLEHNAMSVDSMVMDLIQNLSERYEYVILDAPPVGKESEALSLNQLADTVLFVVGYDNASVPEIQGALDKLEKSGIRVLGCIVNNVQGTKYKDPHEKKNVRRQIRDARKKKQQTESDVPGISHPGETPIAMPASLDRQKNGKKQNSGQMKQSSTGPASLTGTPSVPSSNTETRNVMEELSKEEKAPGTMNDQDVLDELYRIGINREDIHKEKENPSSEKPD